MAATDIAAALQRVESVLQRRPEAGIVDDAPATARWSEGTRVLSDHPGGLQVATDMPKELGGSGDQPSPGWLLRAALASCAVTRIAMAAASAGIALRTLEARAHSRSDARGLLGVPAPDGSAVFAGPHDVQLVVRIGAPGVAADRLQALVQEGCRLAPVSCAMADDVPVALRVEIDGA